MISINAVCSICNSPVPLLNLGTENVVRIQNKICCCGVEVIFSTSPKNKKVHVRLNKNIEALNAQKDQLVKLKKRDQKRNPPGTSKIKKDYTVNIDYIHLADNDARVKQAIVSSIIRKFAVFKSNKLKT